MARLDFSRKDSQRPFLKVLASALFDIPILAAEFRAMILIALRTAADFAAF
jgi:hypothetical protein